VKGSSFNDTRLMRFFWLENRKRLRNNSGSENSSRNRNKKIKATNNQNKDTAITINQLDEEQTEDEEQNDENNKQLKPTKLIENARTLKLSTPFDFGGGAVTQFISKRNMWKKESELYLYNLVIFWW
jgi:hypothetical protein